MKRIDISTKTHPNTFAMVDDDDYEEISKHKWFCTNDGYAARRPPNGYGKKQEWMHRQILGLKKGGLVDHKNGNRLDNRKENIRKCSHSQNASNTGKYKNNSSGYKGVAWNKVTKKWSAQIGINGKVKTLGHFFCLIKAAKAYDEAAKKCHGEFASLNFKGTDNGKG